jgi:hypothetical protein
MRWWTAAVLFLGCAETATDPNAPGPNAAATETTAETKTPSQMTYEIDIWKDEAAGCPVDPDAGPPPEDSDAGAVAKPSAPVDVVPAVRAHVRSCYDDLLAANPEAQGQLVEQVWLAANGDVCAVRPTMRIGLPSSTSACVEKLLRGARFENVRSPLYVPLTYVQKNRGAAYGPPSRIPNLHTCGKTVTVPTEATFEYAADATGKVADLKVDPWKGDQTALECAANAVSATPHGANTTYVARLRFHP